MATKTFNTRIANKRDTSANWTSNNPVLLNGEIIIVDTEAGQVRYKVGNGTSTYTQLPFTDESLIANINGKLSLSGGTMTGNINMGGHKLTGLGAPVNPNDAVRQTDLKVVSDEVDGIISGTTGITLAPATTTKIGGVIVGDGIEVEADGTISTNPVPDGGTEGQMLYKAADGAAWGDKPVMIVNATDSEDASLTTDKTLDEIKEAYLNDVNIFIKYMDGLFPLAFAENVEGENPSFKFFNYSTNIVSGDSYLLVEAEIEIFRTQGEDFAYLYVREGGLVPTDGNQGETLYCDNVGVSYWGPAPKGIPSGGTTGQVLTKTSTGEEWSDAPSGLPEGGTEGQVIKKTADGAEWDNAEWLPLSGGIMDNAVRIRWGSSNGAFVSSGVTTQELRLGSKSINYSNTNLYIGRAPDAGNNVAYLNYDNNELRLHLGGEEENTVGRLTGLKTPVSSNEATPKSYVDTQLSTKLTTPTGTAGQLLGFTADNTVGAVDAPESGLTQEQADDRYLQLSGGALTGNLTIKSGSLWLRGVDCGIWGSFNSSELNFVVNGTEVLKVNGGSMSLPTGLTISGVRTPTSDSEAANKSYVDSKAPTSVTVTLTTSGWSSNTQTVTVSGVSATETAQLITPTPAIASQSAYYEAGIMCTGQAANSLTFTCQTVPTSNLTVYVVIQPLS